jgi:hypothetical protein
MISKEGMRKKIQKQKSFWDVNATQRPCLKINVKPFLENEVEYVMRCKIPSLMLTIISG